MLRWETSYAWSGFRLNPNGKSQLNGLSTMSRIIRTSCFCAFYCNVVLAADPASIPEVVSASGIKGGLIVHVGCGDGQLTAALRFDERYVVQGLDSDIGNVEKARRHIRLLGLCGQVTARKFDGRRLPYVDNLVNLIVADDLGDVPMAEVLRVLSPKGIAYVRSSGRWEKTVKPRPREMDQWTHWLHGADGNAVSQDELLGPPRRIQWTAAPLWSRNHHWVPSVSMMVSANGRLFYILDEGPIGVGGPEPNLDRWFLVARDAFNGVLLWKRPMPRWGWSQWTTKWYGRFNQPHQLAKRLVARGETVYVTLDYGGPLVAVDAASGETTKIYDRTEGADEVLLYGDLIVLACDIGSPSIEKDARRGEKTPPVEKRVCVLDAESGRILWEKKSFMGVHSYSGSPAGRLELVAADDKLALLDNEHVIGLDLLSGEELWRFPRPKSSSRSGSKANERCVLLHAGETVLYGQPDSFDVGYHSFPGHLYAISAQGGALLWKHRFGGWAHQLLPEAFVIDDLVWVHKHVDVELAGKHGEKTGAQKWPVDQPKLPYAVLGIDIRSGVVEREISTREIFNIGHHHRCYRGTATKRFLLTARRGIEFTDLDSGGVDRNNWSRSGCLFGGIPGNGLLYVTPHPCSCYINAQLSGFFALAPSRPGASAEQPDGPPASPRDLIERGPAFGTKPQIAANSSADWPTYCHDNQRSGHSETHVPSELSELWKAEIGGKLSALTIADGRVFASAIDAHRIEALDARSGGRLWSCAAAARVDSPPTIYEGFTLFGCRDGWVYCLRAEDGRLVWRRRLAPDDRQVGAFGQVESIWPVHGSVLVQDAVVYATAGRSSYLDHGILAYAIDFETGEIIEQKRLYSLSPQSGKMPREAYEHRVVAQKMEGHLSDILTGNAESIQMRGQPLFGTLERSSRHYHPKTGFLDDSWFDRVGTRYRRLKTPSQLIVFDHDKVIGMTTYENPGKGSYVIPGTGKYLLTGASQKERRSIWSRNVAVRVRSMVLADDTLFAAGLPDVVPADDPFANFEGRGGGVLTAVSSADGQETGVYRLQSPPVYNGMAAAAGKLYIATTDGHVLCMGSPVR